jgi:NADPH-dependent 2,4-dienoyl-CoA reductase/sulfur reductase-like enzyme/rhodanese-related sulfurtransferase
MKTLIVGGVAGGATAAARLRRLDEEAEIIVFERGEYVSYANCGLPYYVGGVIEDRRELTLRSPAGFKGRFNIEVRILSEVMSINPGERTIKVRDLKTGRVYEESYDKLILSPGAAPIRPKIPGLDNPGVFVLRDIPDALKIRELILTKKPKSALIMGGGSVGVEMAENLSLAGLSVSIVELSDQILSFLDFDMAAMVQNHLRDKGVGLILGNGIKSVEKKGEGLSISLNKGLVEADLLLVSAGVRPLSALARECGLELDDRGYIITDSSMRTSDPDIFAAGDAALTMNFITKKAGPALLAGPANKEGRVAADNIGGSISQYGGSQGSAILKVFDLTVAGTGLNEKTAGNMGLKFDKSFTVSPNHAGYYPGAKNLIIKTIFDPDTGKILGAQVLGGEGVDKRVDIMATAIRFKGSAEDLGKLELSYAPPYGSAKDPVNIAGYVVENIRTGKVKNFHWHEVESLDPEKVTLIDVRTRGEFLKGSIPGFINIELDSIRDHIGELDRKKPVYVTCQVGLRGYLAARILSQKGFDVYNLSGGYSVWKAVNKNLTPLKD